MPLALTVIVPVLNEAAALPLLLGQLQALRSEGAEVLLVDGGSTDGGAALARAAGFTVLDSARGRALQMNTGAAHASNPLLVFLHADTRLPAGALALVRDSLRGAHAWGRFDVRLEGRALMLPVIAALMNARSRLTGIATGDQALFMTRAAFDAAGGFPAQPLMEDIEISKRLKRLSKPVCLRAQATTSGRRWDTRGVWRTIFLMWRLRWAYWRGTPAAELARAYQ